MDTIFQQQIAQGWLKVFMDDILIANKGDRLEMIKKVLIVLQILEENNLFVKPEKCSFFVTSVEFLGFIIEDSKIKMDPQNSKEYWIGQLLLPWHKYEASLDSATSTTNLSIIILTNAHPSINFYKKINPGNGKNPSKLHLKLSKQHTHLNQYSYALTIMNHSLWNAMPL